MNLIFKKIACCLFLISMPSQAVDMIAHDIMRVGVGSLILVGSWESLKKAEAAWKEANALPTMAGAQILKLGALTRVGGVSQAIARIKKNIFREPVPTQEQREQQLAADNLAIFVRRFGPFITWSFSTGILAVGGARLISKALL